MGALFYPPVYYTDASAIEAPLHTPVYPKSLEYLGATKEPRIIDIYSRPRILGPTQDGRSRLHRALTMEPIVRMTSFIYGLLYVSPKEIDAFRNGSASVHLSRAELSYKSDHSARPNSTQLNKAHFSRDPVAVL
jgi:hypothetical protein